MFDLGLRGGFFGRIVLVQSTVLLLIMWVIAGVWSASMGSGVFDGVLLRLLLRL